MAGLLNRKVIAIFKIHNYKRVWLVWSCGPFLLNWTKTQIYISWGKYERSHYVKVNIYKYISWKWNAAPHFEKVIDVSFCLVLLQLDYFNHILIPSYILGHKILNNIAQRCLTQFLSSYLRVVRLRLRTGCRLNPPLPKCMFELKSLCKNIILLVSCVVVIGTSNWFARVSWICRLSLWYHIPTSLFSSPTAAALAHATQQNLVKGKCLHPSLAAVCLCPFMSGLAQCKWYNLYGMFNELHVCGFLGMFRTKTNMFILLSSSVPFLHRWHWHSFSHTFVNFCVRKYPKLVLKIILWTIIELIIFTFF